MEQPLAPGAQTPKSLKFKKTILDMNDTYMEEDDETYVYEEEDESESEKEDETDEEIEDKTQPLVLDPTTGSKLHQFLVKHEVVRKAMHSLIGVVVLGAYCLGYETHQFLAPLLGLFSILLATDYIRLGNPEFNKFIVSKAYYIVRESEFYTYNGTLYYLAGVLFSLGLFPKDIAVMSILLLSWADTAASTFGRQFGKYTFQISHGKSFAGCLASFVVGALSCYLFYGYFVPVYDVNKPGAIFWEASTSSLDLHSYALISGLVASISECVGLFGLDDNFTIPVLSSIGLYAAVSFFKL